MDEQTKLIAEALEALRQAKELFAAAAEADGPRSKAAVAELRNHTECFIEMLDNDL